MNAINVELTSLKKKSKNENQKTKRKKERPTIPQVQKN
jgi:hypothetical protein